MPTNCFTIPIQNTHVYSLNFADDQVLIAQGHDDMEFMARKLKKEYKKMGTSNEFKKNQIYMYRKRKRKFKI
jgi:hypothetical protein